MGIQKALPFPIINGEQSSKAIKSISSLTDPLTRKKFPLEATSKKSNGCSQPLAHQKPEKEDDESSESSLEPKKNSRYLSALATSAPAILNRIKVGSSIKHQAFS